MSNREQDPYERMTDEAFDQADQSWKKIDEDFNDFNFEDEGPRHRTERSTAYPRSKEEKDWVTGVHAAALIGYVFPMAWVLGPLVIWLAKKDEMPALDVHGRDVLNFQLSMVIYMAIASILIFVFIGIPALVVLGIVQLVATILGIIKASQGERFKYPWSLNIL